MRRWISTVLRVRVERTMGRVVVVVLDGVVAVEVVVVVVIFINTISNNISTGTCILFYDFRFW
ncbi:hypothetical protein HanIR_Chr04g0169411 [Helianthus annuus]|nr:hypothetical protein HanIR_Chr04g0169411 [Helianthus annuus]